MGTHVLTRDTCDSMKLQIELAATLPEKEALQKKHEEHLSLAESVYKAFCYYQELCKKSWKSLQGNDSTEPSTSK